MKNKKMTFKLKRKLGFMMGLIWTVSSLYAWENSDDWQMDSGIMSSYYNLATRVPDAMPDFSSITATLVRVETTIDHPSMIGRWPGLTELYDENFASRHETFLKVPVSGEYVLTIETDDAAELWLDGVRQIATEPPVATSSATCFLTEGLHACVVTHYQSSDEAALRLFWEGPSLPFELIPAEAFCLPHPVGYEYGLLADYYDLTRLYTTPAARDALVDLPCVDAIQPTASTVSMCVRFPSVTTPWYGMPSALTDWFAARYTGSLLIDQAGVYTFALKANQGARVFIDEVELVTVNTDSPNEAGLETASCSLTAGFHDFRVEYYEKTGSSQLSLYWQTPSSIEMKLVPPEVFFHAVGGATTSSQGSAPAVTLLEPLNEPHGVGNTFSFVASAYDRDDDLAFVSFYVNDRFVANGVRGADGLWRGSWRNDSLTGNLTLTAHAEDAAGNLAVSAPLTRSVEVPPSGYAFGWQARFWHLDAACTNVSDAIFATPADFETRVDRVRYPSTDDAESWAGLPASFRNHYVGEFTGEIWLKESGEHEWTVRANDGASLWVDGVCVLSDLNRHTNGIDTSLVLYLSEGFHSVVLRYFEFTGIARLSILDFTRTDVASDYMPRTRFVYQTGCADLDQDGLPDWWETRHGLNPQDSSDATQDNDGDGLDNVGEYAAGSDPQIADTDRDGIPDGWEYAHGLCAYLNDALFDADGDGLSNIVEYRHGTNPHVRDTDEDGFDDGVEILSYRSNPLVADMAPGLTSLSVPVSGASFTASTGHWMVENDRVVADQRAGSLTWHLMVPTGGADALAVEITQAERYAHNSRFDLSLYVDGIFVSRILVESPYGEMRDAVFACPELTAGEHAFRLVWNNCEVNTFLAVNSLRFVRLNGLDADEDGVPDWRQTRAGQVTQLDNLPCESAVSPLCVEGTDLWRDALEVRADYPDGTFGVFAVAPTVGEGFYANVDLAETGATHISLDNRSAADAFDVVWKPTDVFSNENLAFRIREGDAMRFAAYDNQPTDFEIVSAQDPSVTVTNWTTHGVTAYTFATAGVYEVRAVAESGLWQETNGCARVEVVTSRFPLRNLAVFKGSARTLRANTLDQNNVIEHDPDLSVVAESVMGFEQDPDFDRHGGVPYVKLDLYTLADEDLGLVSRVSENGAISDAIQVSPIWYDNGTYCRVEQTYPDGSQLVEVSILLGNVPADIIVKLEVFVTGVTFEDGTCVKTLTADDFDDDGMCAVRFIRIRGSQTSVCHRTSIYQDGRQLFRNKE